MTATVPTFNPFDPSMIEDPYPAYAQFRTHQAVQKVSMMGLDTFVFSKYDDVSAVLRNHEVFSSRSLAMGGDEMPRSLISTDPPDHTKLRRLVSRPFQPSAIAMMEPRIRDLTNELVDQMIDANRAGSADLVQQLSYPLPMTVIAEMLGIPSERRADFKRWSDHAMGSANPALMVGSPAMNEEFMAGPDGEMRTFFGEVAEERRRNPGDDLISMLVAGKEPLTSEELLMFCVLLLVAGNETTTNLISNATLALFAFPDEAEDVVVRPLARAVGHGGSVAVRLAGAVHVPAGDHGRHHQRSRHSGRERRDGALRKCEPRRRQVPRPRPLRRPARSSRSRRLRRRHPPVSRCRARLGSSRRSSSRCSSSAREICGRQVRVSGAPTRCCGGCANSRSPSTPPDERAGAPL